MKFIRISNKGIVESQAFHLIGASSKVGDNDKIGVFGSGLKYAIARLMRGNIPFKVFSGSNEIIFSTDVQVHRGIEFNRILINNEPTSFTTTMGKDWEAWFTVREIYCNALDEPESAISIVDFIDSNNESETTFYIGITDELEELITNWNLYFSEKRSDIITYKGDKKVFKGDDSTILYRKGIRCYYNSSKRSFAHYDFDDFTISEDRVSNNEYKVADSIAKFWAQSARTEDIEKLLEALHGNQSKTDYFENSNSYWGEHKLSDNWIEALKGRKVVESDTAGWLIDLCNQYKPFFLPSRLVSRILRDFGREYHVAGKEGKEGTLYVKTTERQSLMINKAKEILKQGEYEVPYTIKTAIFHNSRVFAKVLDGEIVLSDKCFSDIGTLIKALIEETEHIKTGFDDCTREFQQHFIDLYIKEKAERFLLIF